MRRARCSRPISRIGSICSRKSARCCVRSSSAGKALRPRRGADQMTARLTAILDLTEQVQAAIDRGDWQRARELEVARRDAIVQLVAEGAADASLPSTLADLYARNQRMLGEVDR